jgi:hypothetical protein
MATVPLALPLPPLTIAKFRADFPEFADQSVYPDAQIAGPLTIAATLIQNATRWGALLVMGQELVAAHYLVLAARATAAAANGATPGTAEGLLASEAAGPLSASYDYSTSAMESGGQWNLTSYGQRYYSLARVFGAGGIQLGSCGCNY